MNTTGGGHMHSERESENNNNKEHELNKKNESRMLVGVHLQADVFIHSFICIRVYPSPCVRS